MALKDKKKDYKIRIIKSDLSELQERINFLTGNSWDISVGIDGVEDVDNSDGRLKIKNIPPEWPLKVMLEWIRQRKVIRQQVVHSIQDEIAHLEFVEALATRHLKEEQ